MSAIVEEALRAGALGFTSSRTMLHRAKDGKPIKYPAADGPSEINATPVFYKNRIYVATGQSADVFSPKGEFLGSIPGPKGMHGVFIGGKDKTTLYGIVFYGGWGTPSARNQIVAIPLLAQGYKGRTK